MFVMLEHIAMVKAVTRSRVCILPVRQIDMEMEMCINVRVYPHSSSHWASRKQI